MQASVASLMDDVTDPSDWKHDFTILKNLDASLRCDLCFDIYTSPVSIKSCHHTFCSTCIRTHINQSGNSGSFCPKCRQTKAYDSELIPQPVLEVTALEWTRARAFLARLQTEHDERKQQKNATQAAESSRSAHMGSAKRSQSDHDAEHNSASSSANPSPRRSKRVRTEVLKPAGSRSSPLTIDDDEDDFIDGTDDDMDAEFGANGLSRKKGSGDDGDADYVQQATSSRTSPSKRRTHFADESSTPRSDRDLKADDLVECPICSHRFTVTALNRHLDSANCYPGFPEPSPEERGIMTKPAKTTSSWFTKGAASTSTAADGASSMANEKRLVRPQYNLRSDRELRKLLDDAGLPTNGDRERLTERHRQWINIWNANLDSTKARRSVAQLRKDLNAWERTRYSAKDHSAHVDKQKTTWVKTNKSQFDELIEKAKKGAAKDKQLRDAPHRPSSEDATSSSTAPNGLHHSGDADVHVITSSPADSLVGPEQTRAAEAES